MVGRSFLILLGLILAVAPVTRASKSRLEAAHPRKLSGPQPDDHPPRAGRTRAWLSSLAHLTIPANLHTHKVSTGRREHIQ